MAQSTFLTTDFFPGIQGLNLFRAPDEVDPLHCLRLTNLVRNEEAELTGRPGLTSLITTGSSFTNIQALFRVRIPSTLGISGTYDYFFIADGTLYASIDAASPTQIATGFSHPVVALQYHTALGSEPWVIFVSTNKMGKIRVGSHAYRPLGLLVPDQPNLSVSPVLTKQIPIDMGWTANAGTGGAPTITLDATDYVTTVPSLKFTTNKGGASGAYYNFANESYAIDLSTIGGSPASDDDIIHFWLKCDQPSKISEIRLYFVCNSGIDLATLPGSDTAVNTEAYVKVIRPSDFQTSFTSGSSTVTAADAATAITQTLQQLVGATSTLVPLELGLTASWQELGTVEVPLHRGDFTRIGTDLTRDWSGVSGLTVFVATTDNTTGINLWIDGLDLRGGAGPDTSLFGSAPYDYRVTDYDLLTGAESNGSDPLASTSAVQAARQTIVITPASAGDSNIRQRFYRRGGSIVDGWYLVGQNNSDGDPFYDTLDDLTIRIPVNILLEDNDAPVTTVDENGGAIYGAKLQAIWGPVSDLLFGCGDRYRPGELYWSKVNNPDSWPLDFHLEACSSDEELMNGAILAGQAFAFSRERCFSIIPNLGNVNQVAVVPTQCTHGLASRRAIAIAVGRMWFVSRDGIYSTTGDPEVSITNSTLYPLFMGESRSGYFPIDWDYADSLELTAAGNELFFTYRDTQGDYQTLIYHLFFKYWRHASFAPGVATVADQIDSLTVLMASPNAGTIYTHTGLDDAGTPIPARFTSAYFHQGQPRQDKLYGDIVIDANRADTTLTVTPLFNVEASSGTPTSLTTLTGRNRYYADTQATQAQNMAIDIQWETSSSPPTLYKVSYSVSPQTDTTALRVTDWETGGRASDKYVKGIVFECDTGGLPKELAIYADQALQTTITVTAAGRRVVEVSFPQFLGRLLRIAPTDTTEWKMYSYTWIFDEEPLSLTRWETQPLSHNTMGYHSLLYSNLTLKSSGIVTLLITSYYQSGTSTSLSYSIPSTGDEKRKVFLPYQSNNGVLHKYLFTADDGFWLYREESDTTIQPWGGSPIVAKPFGSDDLDLTRSLNSSEFIASRSGWNLASTSRQQPSSPSGQDLQE